MKKKFGIGICCLWAVFVALIIMGLNGPTNNAVPAPGLKSATVPVPKALKEPQPKQKRRFAQEQVELQNYEWRKDDFVMTATFDIRNNSDFSVKDLKIKCVHYAPSGTRIDSNTETIYEKIAPHMKRQFADVNMGLIHSQAARSHCEIIDLAKISD